MIYVSGNEPRLVKTMLKTLVKIEESNNQTESFGADFSWMTPFGRAGVQRKAFPGDFLDSLKYGDRLAKEVLQMESSLTWRMLIMEAEEPPRWGSDGNLQGQFKGGITQNHLEAVLESIDFFRNIRVRWTTGEIETARKVFRFYQWTMKNNHTGFCGNRTAHPEGQKKEEEMKVSWIEWILMGFPGVSSVLAKRIMELEPEPLVWACELEKVPGIGKIKAAALRRALEPK